MSMKLTAADKTDVGKQRENNEDLCFKRVQSLGEGDCGLFIVSDGMGGYQAGEVASKLAIETISKALADYFEATKDQLVAIEDQPTTKLDFDPDATVQMNPLQKIEDIDKTIKLEETPLVKPVEKRIEEAIQKANDAIISYGEKHPSARGLGSTVTMVLVFNDQAYIGNIGDSRTYLLRQGKLKPLTKDHSLVARLVETKQIDPEDVYSHPQRNVIYRSLGAGRRQVEPDIFHERLEAGDTLLLCTDGLWEMVRPHDIEQELSQKHSPQTICDRLIERANAGGGEDNITAVVVQISPR